MNPLLAKAARKWGFRQFVDSETGKAIITTPQGEIVPLVPCADGVWRPVPKDLAHLMNTEGEHR